MKIISCLFAFCVAFGGLSPAEDAKVASQQEVCTTMLEQREAKPKKSKKAPKAQLDQPTNENATGSAAMYAFARQPAAPGAVGPKLGKYAVIQTPIKYSESASPEAIAAAEATTYVVVAGDILGRIAQKHGCTIAQIQKANRMPNDQIKIGQKLLIPNCSSDTAEEQQPLVAEAPAPTAPRGKWWKRVGVNTTELPKLMAAEGFKPPQKFMAFILELTFDDTRQVVTRERAFDYKGTSSLNSGWNPASAVKIFAAIAALRRIDELGFTSRAKVTFNSTHLP